ncbi:MAG: hypothetical protein QM477_11290 [Planctomycetota bacterium]
MTLLRTFSVVLWHHFAAPLISFALIGGAIGMMSVAKDWDSSTAKTPFHWRLLGLGLAHLGLWAFLGNTRFMPFRALLEGDVAAILNLLCLLVLVLASFFFVGAIIGQCMRQSGGALSKIYACDLFGGLAGIVWFFFVGGKWGPLSVLLFQASMCFVVAFFLRPSLHWKHFIAGAAMVVLVFWGSQSDGLKFPQGKTLFQSEQYIEKTVWAAEGRIDVLQPIYGIYQGMGGVAHTKRSEDFNYRLLAQDGGAPSAIIGLSNQQEGNPIWGRYLQAAPFIIADSAKVLVIGAGGGLEVVLAAHSKAREIDAVDLNHGLQEMLKEDYASYQDHLFDRKNVNLIWSEGRQYLRKTESKYDVILLAGVDTFLSSPGGANALAERYLYTVEAVVDALQALTLDGVFSMTRRIFEPASESLRFLTTVVEVLEDNPQAASRDCVIMVEGPKRPGQAVWANCLVKPSGFSMLETQAIEAWARTSDLKVLASPASIRSNIYAEYLNASPAKRKAMVQNYPLDIAPCTDEFPFFFMWERRDQIFGALSLWLRGRGLPQGEVTEQEFPLGLLLSLLTGAIVVLIGIALGLWSWMQSKKRAHRVSVLGVLFFTCTGGAFLFAEISLFHLAEYLTGIASYSFAAAVGGLLLGGGIGAFSLKWARIRCFCASILSLGLYVLWQSQPQVESLSTSLILVSCISIALGVCLGSLYPLGVQRFAGPHACGQKSFYLGVSSWASVLCASLSSFLVWYWGMSSIGLLAAGLFLGAGLLCLGKGAMPAK